MALVQRSAKVGVDGGEMHAQRWRGDPGAPLKINALV